MLLRPSRTTPNGLTPTAGCWPWLRHPPRRPSSAKGTAPAVIGAGRDGSREVGAMAPSAIMTDLATSLEGLLADPSRATQIPREEAVALLTKLATLQMALLAAASRAPAVVPHEREGQEPDLMLNV